MSTAQRQAADPHASAFVTANAGSGKTKTLIDRTARLLLAGVDPAQILCVTYTKAAAAEMQRRLFELLGDWSIKDNHELSGILADLEGREADSFTQAELSRARTLFARALETPGGLKIQTIHAFCEKLLRRFPLEAGILPGFKVIEDATAAAIAAQARAAVAEAVLAGTWPALTDAYARFSVALDFQAFQDMFKTFEIERGAIAAFIDGAGGLDEALDLTWDNLGFQGAVDPGDLGDALAAPLDYSVWIAAAEALIQAGKDAKLSQALVRAVALRDLDSALAALFTKAGQGTPATVIARSAVLSAHPALQAALLRDQDSLEIARERVRAAQIGWDSCRALTLAHAYGQAYEAAKRAYAVLDFADLIERTVRLMSSGPAAAWVLYKLDGGVDHILLDEAQDTAPEQWAILEALTGEFFSGAGRPVDRPIPRTLFIVGDEKQSIYSFQGAAPERLIAETRAYTARIVGEGGRAVSPLLAESWRSVKQVLGFIDVVFRPPDIQRAVQPDAVEPMHHTVTRQGHAGCVDLWEPEQERTEDDRTAWDAPLDAATAGSANRRLADRIAGEIAALVARGDGVFDKPSKAWRGADYGDVLILVRRRGVLFEEILRALKRRGIPVAGADRLALSAHIAFDDLMALARFVLFPDDDLTLAALLKSPFCDVDDDSLYRLAWRRPASLWAALSARRDEDPAWDRAWRLLSTVQAEARTRRPFDLFGWFLSRLDETGRSMRARMLGRLGMEAQDALDEFTAQVLVCESQGLHDLESVTQALSGLDILVKREMEASKGQVRVMTAHGAKGLEAPIVILPEMTLDRAPHGGPLLRTADGGILWCSSAANDCDLSKDARERRQQREADERLRLLYVALTRARDRLILCGRIGARTDRAKVGGWYAAAEQALAHADLADDVRTLEADGLSFRRYGPDPEPMTPFMAERVQTGAPPAWLACPPAAEPAGLRYVSPSALADAESADDAASPLARVGGLGRFRRGSLIHRLLQLLPDIPQVTRRDAAVRLLAREPDLTGDQRAEMVEAAIGVLDDDRFAAVFGPGSRPEVAVAGQAKALPSGMAVGGRLDRLVVEQDRVLVVDFKTNRPSPARIEDADPAYITQMAAYAAVLAEAFPDHRIEAALVWTDGPKLMAVPENMLTAALARLNGTS